MCDADTSGGVAYNLMFVSNEFQIDDENDNRVSGVVFLDILYRHAINDPRRVA